MNFIPKDRCHFLWRVYQLLKDRGWGVNPPSGIKGEGKMGNSNKNQPLKDEGTSPLL
jgi:hypothetical protein